MADHEIADLHVTRIAGPFRQPGRALDIDDDETGGAHQRLAWIDRLPEPRIGRHAVGGEAKGEGRHLLGRQARRGIGGIEPATATLPW